MTMSSAIAACLLMIVVAITAADGFELQFGEQVVATKSKDHHASMESNDMFEGDMNLTPEQDEAIQAQIRGESLTPDDVQGKALRSLSTRWPDATVPYEIDASTAHETELLERAMRHWELRTCLQFVPKTSQGNYIRFLRSSGCWSYVGMIGGRQDISIGNGCEWLDIVVHEIGHAIGFFHEQSRPDRDEYIIIHLANVPESYRNNFNKYTTDQVTTHDTPYDISSVMHYSPYAFSTNGQPTISVRDDNPQDPSILGAAEGLTCSDIALANLAYSCSETDGWEDYECDPEEEGHNYEYTGEPEDPEDPEDPEGGSHSARLQLYLENGHRYVSSDEENVDVFAGEPFTVVCYSTLRVTESEYDETQLEITLDGDVIDPDDRYIVASELSYYYDSSEGEGDGRPLIEVELVGRTEDHGKLLTCTVGTTGDREVENPEASMMLRVGCQTAFHVPCGDECLDNLDLVCNGDEDCPGGTDELDCDDRCDRIFDDGEEGVFTSHPGYNDGENYANNIDCATLIRAPEGQSVVLQFEEFNLESHSECGFDFVEVYDGDSHRADDARLVGRFCGRNVPRQIVSRRSGLLVFFHTDASVTRSGFLANFGFQDRREGGGNITGIIDAYAGAFNGFVDFRVPQDASDWIVVLTFDRKLRSLKLTGTCMAEVVAKRGKSTRFIIQNKGDSRSLEAGEFLYFEFTAITSPSRTVKGATAGVEFSRR